MEGSYSYVAATYQSTLQIATALAKPQPVQPGDLLPSSPLHHARGALGYSRTIGRHFVIDGLADITGVSGQFLRGDEVNQLPEIPGYTVTGLHAHASWDRYGLQLDIDNLFDRRYYTFGIVAQNSFGPVVGSTTLVSNPQIVPFYTPGYARRVTIALTARL